MGYWYSEEAGRWTLLGFGIFVLAGGLIGTCAPLLFKPLARFQPATPKLSLVPEAVAGLARQLGRLLLLPAAGVRAQLLVPHHRLLHRFDRSAKPRNQFRGQIASDEEVYALG